MVIETSRFGTISVSENDIISFPEGMLGFSKIHEYVLVERVDDGLFLWLQALKKPSVAFPLLEPQIFHVNYQVELSDEDREMIELEKLSATKVFAIITIPSDPTKMTANLKAPIVVNLRNRKARQVILHNQDYPIRQSIFTELQAYCETKQREVFLAGEAPSYQAVQLDIETEKPVESAV